VGSKRRGGVGSTRRGGVGSKREGVNIEAPTSISLSQGLKLARHGV